MLITYIHSNWLADKASVQNRCRNLADAINRTGGMHHAELLDINSFVANTPNVQRLCAHSDLLVIHRHLHGDILTAIQYWKARDKKVIVDFDQAINHLTKDMSSYAFWYDGVVPDQPARMDPPPIEQFKWGLGMIDAATVSSDRLADDWSGYTTVHKVVDYVNTYRYPALQQNHGKEIWIGLRRRENIGCFAVNELFTALKNVCGQRPDVKILFHGVEGDDTLPDIPARQLKTFRQGDGKEWTDILPALDLGLLLTCGDYDLRLGNFDLLEFMISKVPWVASGAPSHQRLSRYGKWIQNTASVWERVLLDAVDYHSLYRKKASAEPFLFALSQDMHANIDKVLKVYADILSP